MEQLIAGFTGTQGGMTTLQLHAVRTLLRDQYGPSAAHHGDCVGADAQFHALMVEQGVPIHLHPPDVDSKRAFCDGATNVADAKPYLDRNHDIVDACRLLVAAPSGPAEKRRSGTWATVRYARKQHRGIVIVLPDGELRVES